MCCIDVWHQYNKIRFWLHFAEPVKLQKYYSHENIDFKNALPLGLSGKVEHFLQQMFLLKVVFSYVTVYVREYFSLVRFKCAVYLKLLWLHVYINKYRQTKFVSCSLSRKAVDNMFYIFSFFTFTKSVMHNAVHFTSTCNKEIAPKES